MPEVKDRAAAAIDRSGGFFIARVMSPGTMMVASRPRRARRVSLEENKENNLQGLARRRKSPLPVWYPRTPLRDITDIVNVLEMRRVRRMEAARAAQQRSLSTQASPPQVAPPSLVATPPSQELIPPPSEVPHDKAAAEAPLVQPPLKAAVSEGSSVTATNESSSSTAEFPLLCSMINEIEKSAEEYMKKKAAREPAKKAVAAAVQRRTLMSMR